MTDKKRARLPVKTEDKAGASIEAARQKFNDGFSNVLAKIGIGTDNLSSRSNYVLDKFLSRDRQQLDAAYRGSWLVGRVVDAIAEDMTKDGVTFTSEMAPDDMQKMQSIMSEWGVWQSICDSIRWARLYGGCIAVILTDGADYTKPLRFSQIGKNTFRGLLVLDRWMISPSVGDLITDMTKDMGMPKYYQVIAGVSAMPSLNIHHSRVLRFDGIKLPYYQRLFENMWGLSVIERMLDRLLAFDSATQGAAQLLYKSHLRVVSVKGFREALALGGKTEDAVIKQFGYIRSMQTNEGLTVLDADDKFDYHATTFSGIAELIDQFATQISGATNIPIVRLFGQSPSGFSTGETDLRNYYDDVNKLQENILRPQLNKLFEVLARSVLGNPLPEDFEFTFNPLWTLSDSEKSQIAATDTNTISTAFTQGVITKGMALTELLQQSHVTGRFTNISEEDIEAAKEEPPEPDMSGEGGGMVPGMEEGGMMPPMPEGMQPQPPEGLQKPEPPAGQQPPEEATGEPAPIAKKKKETTGEIPKPKPKVKPAVKKPVNKKQAESESFWGENEQ